jgi:hypothetical protein
MTGTTLQNWSTNGGEYNQSRGFLTAITFDDGGSGLPEMYIINGSYIGTTGIFGTGDVVTIGNGSTLVSETTAYTGTHNF